MTLCNCIYIEDLGSKTSFVLLLSLLDLNNQLIVQVKKGF